MDKIVQFDKFCRFCVNSRTPADVEPCNSCMAIPVNSDSRRPVYFKPKKGVNFDEGAIELTAVKQFKGYVD